MRTISAHQVKRLEPGTKVTVRDGKKTREYRLVRYGRFGPRLQDVERPGLYIKIDQRPEREYMTEDA